MATKPRALSSLSADEKETIARSTYSALANILVTPTRVWLIDFNHAVRHAKGSTGRRAAEHADEDMMYEALADLA